LTGRKKEEALSKTKKKGKRFREARKSERVGRRTTKSDQNRKKTPNRKKASE